MALFFAYQRLRVLLRVGLPLALGVDMVHSFYYVGRLIQEKRNIEAEKERRLTLYATTALFKRVRSIPVSKPKELSSGIARLQRDGLQFLARGSTSEDTDCPSAGHVLCATAELRARR